MVEARSHDCHALLQFGIACSELSDSVSLPPDGYLDIKNSIAQAAQSVSALASVDELPIPNYAEFVTTYSSDDCLSCKARLAELLSAESIIETDSNEVILAFICGFCAGAFALFLFLRLFCVSEHQISAASASAQNNRDLVEEQHVLNFRWSSYFLRFCCYAFFLAVFVELVRLTVLDYATYQAHLCTLLFHVLPRITGLCNLI